MSDIPNKRILIVDDSTLVRRMLAKLIEATPGLEVAYAAPSGALAIKRLELGKVDLVLLDVEMPEMTGIQATAKIRKRWPTLPIVMCSAFTEKGALVTLEALEKGATDYIAKPSGGSGGMAEFERDLIKKIHGILGVHTRSHQPAAAPPLGAAARLVRQTKINLLAIGCSTGGPNALATICAALSRPLPVPTVIVQHMPAMFTRLLAERLSSVSGLVVKEGEHGEALVAGTSYIAPGGKHMLVQRDVTGPRIVLNDDPPECSCRPAVDVLFRSVAQNYGSSALAVVLTGMGYDGTAGAQALVEKGATVLVQDPASCVIDSMPTSVSQAGLAQRTVPLEKMADEFQSRAAYLRGTVRPKKTARSA